jgi:thioesterase domain-containing protein
MVPFNNFVFLFKAKKRLYYVNDFKYLGWRKYAKKGVKVFEVPGDHITMLQQPYVSEFGRILQGALDNC